MRGIVGGDGCPGGHSACPHRVPLECVDGDAHGSGRAAPCVESEGRTIDGYAVRDAPGWTFKANGRDNEGRFDFLVADIAYRTGPP